MNSIFTFPGFLLIQLGIAIVMAAESQTINIGSMPIEQLNALRESIQVIVNSLPLVHSLLTNF